MADKDAAGWGRTVVSSYFHWFEASEETSETDTGRSSVCAVVGDFRGEILPNIVRWETAPSICEICRDIRIARAKGKLAAGEPCFTVAIVPPGLSDRIRAFFHSAADLDLNGPPFYYALTQFRPERVTKQFLSAFLRYDAQQSGKPSRQPVGWRDITLDEVREVEGTQRVKIVREAKRGRK